MNKLRKIASLEVFATALTLVEHVVRLVHVHGSRRTPALRVLIALGAVALTMASFVPPALADSGPTQYCVTNVGLTIYDAERVVRGSGSMACSGSNSHKAALVVWLQRRRWNGWETLSKNAHGYESFPVNWALGVGRFCQQGTGTFTYRTVSRGYVLKQWGWISTKEVVSNELRVSC